MGAAEDRRFMGAALRLARWNTGLTSTNPSVACIVVRDGAIVGTGVTARGGRPHAEPQALAEAGEAARGATAYVTLEPCSHHGKTPPCANALIASGVARVVIAVTDPDARVSGRGVAMLRAAGIAVETDVLEAEGRRVLAAYLTRQIEKRAHVTLKLAVSADGMIGRRGAGQVAITGPLARAQVHALRAEMDAILVGSGTALADDPELTVRLTGLSHRSPRRFVLGHRALPDTLKLVRTAGDVPVTLVRIGPAHAGTAAPVAPSAGPSDHLLPGGEKREQGAGVTISSPRRGEVPAGGEGAERQGISRWMTPSLNALLVRMAEDGISSLMVEGGAGVAAGFIEAGLVDRILLYQGPDTIGSDGIASPVTPSHMPPGFRLVAEEQFGPDRAWHYERET